MIAKITSSAILKVLTAYCAIAKSMREEYVPLIEDR